MCQESGRRLSRQLPWMFVWSNWSKMATITVAFLFFCFFFFGLVWFSFVFYVCFFSLNFLCFHLSKPNKHILDERLSKAIISLKHLKCLINSLILELFNGGSVLYVQKGLNKSLLMYCPIAQPVLASSVTHSFATA